MTGKEDKTDTAKAEVANPESDEESGVVEAQQTPDAAGQDAVDSRGAEDSGQAEAQQKSTKAGARRVSVSLRTLVAATVVAALLALSGVLTWLYLGAEAKLDEQARRVADNSHAERIALDYAVDAAKINAQDLEAWKKNLVKGTSPALNEKLSSAATSMQQILAPMQWNSTAIPLVAKVRSNANGIYIVDTFVGVETKTVQAPDGLQSTATYSITIDSNHDWQISDVGGIGTVVGQK